EKIYEKWVRDFDIDGFRIDTVKHVGCVTAFAGALAGIVLWAPHGKGGLLDGFEGTSNWNVLRVGLPLMILGGIAAALAVFFLVRRDWKRALGCVAAIGVLFALGVAVDALAGAPRPECYDPC
ncbi:alpha-amylase family glycosyl hydrolase, partial [Streptomyces globisporus]